MSSATEGRKVTIVAPYDNSVTSEVMEESLPVWEDLGWTVKADAPATAPAPNTTGMPRPVVSPADPTVKP